MKLPSRRRVITRAVAAVLAWMAVAPIPAQAGDCQEKLSAVNKRLEQAGDLGPTRAGLEMMRDQGATMCGQGRDAMAMQEIRTLVVSGGPQ